MKTAILIIMLLLAPTLSSASWDYLPSSLTDDSTEEIMEFEDVLYCTSYMGFLYSWDEAEEIWSMVGDGLEHNGGIRAVAIRGDQAVLSLMMAGGWRCSRIDGVWGTWEALPEPDVDIHEIAFVGDRLFASRDGGFFVSDDLGSTWQLTSLPTTDHCDFVGFVDGVLLVHTNLGYINDPGGEVFVSGDLGLTWKNVSAFFQRASFGAVCEHDGELFLAFNYYNSVNSIFRSIDDGQSWTELHAYPAMTNLHALISDSQRLFIGGYPPSGTNLSVHYSPDLALWTTYVGGLTNYYHRPVNQMVLVGEMLYKTGGGAVMRAPLPALSGSDHDDLPTVDVATLSNHPNPFNPSTTIKFSLNRSGPTELTILDLAGRKVRTLLNGIRESGDHQIVWDGKDNGGLQVTTGMYFVQLQNGQDNLTHKITLLK